MRRSLRPADEPAVFEEFVRQHRARLVRVACTLTAGDAHLAEDLVQQCLVKVYLRTDRAPIADLPAYANRMIVNALIDHRRRVSVRREKMVSDLPEIAGSDAIQINESIDPQLTTALRSLGPKSRAAVVLRHVEGYSVEETADLLRCSNGTVKSLASRGLAKLRRSLGEAHPETSTYETGDDVTLGGTDGGATSVSVPNLASVIPH